ncbi:MAG: septum formation initiator family protein [Rhodospirillales bacterium]|nr:septum formation initiator family protein [Rhodospirillales bacterium]
MALVHEIKKRARQVAPQFFLACLAAYFGYHAIQGDRGILARHRLQQELLDAQSLRQQLTEERAYLTHRVELLRPDSLDSDMLEERARALLNFSRPDEYIVVVPGRSLNETGSD